MSGKWKEVARLTFKGDRFRDHALDLGALTELSQFQKVVAEAAKMLWRAKNPNQKLPPRFENRTRLCLRQVGEGSAVAPLEVYIDEPEQGELLEREPVEVEEAVDLAYKVYDATARKKPIRDEVPRELVNEFSLLGQTLANVEEMDITTPIRQRAARITAEYRTSFAVQYVETPHEADVDIEGVVLEADVKQHRFQLWISEKTNVSVLFSETQESDVTTALKEHAKLRLHVKGKGEVTPQGKTLRIKDVYQLRIVSPVDDKTLFDETARPIEDVIAEIVSDIPAEEWAKLPKDLNENLDHYLYGLPKK